MAHGDPRLHVQQRQFPGAAEGGADGELRHAVLIAAAVVVHGFIVLDEGAMVLHRRGGQGCGLVFWENVAATS